jgi:soluble lytic murein transglycosylase
MSKQENTAITTKMKIWTVLCILLVCATAFVVRGVLVYKIFPLDYEESIIKYSEEYEIDKYLVCAVIFAESGFDDTARSSAGAVGVMQIIPGTGEWAAEKIGIESYNEQMLLDPDINIRIGCWYLSYLGAKFENDSEKFLAAYNAGPSKVEEWIDSDGTLREIPYEETENYVLRIKRYYNIYKGLYNDL